MNSDFLTTMALSLDANYVECYVLGLIRLRILTKEVPPAITTSRQS